MQCKIIGQRFWQKLQDKQNDIKKQDQQKVFAENSMKEKQGKMNQYKKHFRKKLKIQNIYNNQLDAQKSYQLNINNRKQQRNQSEKKLQYRQNIYQKLKQTRLKSPKIYRNLYKELFEDYNQEDMCGRMFANINLNELRNIINIQNYDQLDNFQFSNYNILPSEKAVIYKDKKIQLSNFGINDKEFFLKNAKSETYLNSGYYNLLERCVIIINGFYEFRRHNVYAFKKLEGYMFLAALKNDDGFVILTQSSLEPIAQYHRRMPIFLEDYQVEQWGNYDKDLQIDLVFRKNHKIQKYIKQFAIYEVSDHVRKQKNKDQACILSKENYRKQHGIRNFYDAKKNQHKSVDITRNLKETKDLKEINEEGHKKLKNKNKEIIFGNTDEYVKIHKQINQFFIFVPNNSRI